MEKTKMHLSRIPFPEKGTDEAFARGLIEMVLNATLNRYASGLRSLGYLTANDAGWVNGKPSELLQLKFDVMDEAVQIFAPQVIEELKNRDTSK